MARGEVIEPIYIGYGGMHSATKPLIATALVAVAGYLAYTEIPSFKAWVEKYIFQGTTTTQQTTTTQSSTNNTTPKTVNIQTGATITATSGGATQITYPAPTSGGTPTTVTMKSTSSCTDQYIIDSIKALGEAYEAAIARGDTADAEGYHQQAQNLRAQAVKNGVATYDYNSSFYAANGYYQIKICGQLV